MGPSSLLAVLDTVVRPSLLHAPGRLGLAAWLPPDLLVRVAIVFIVPAGFATLLVLSGLIVRAWIVGRAFDKLPVTDRFLLIAAGVLLTALLAILACRHLLGMPYPEQRIVLYWIPLLGLAAVGVMQRYRALAFPLGALLVLCVVQFATQLNTRYYAEWAYCASTKDMMAVIRSGHAANPAARVRLGVTWQLEPGVNFYRSMWGLNWIEPVFRQSPDGDNDYYLLLYGDRGLVERRGLKTLLSDTLSGAVLARPY